MASINIKKDGQWTGKPVLGFKVGEENLTDELKEKIANGANVDLSGYATKEEVEALTAADVGAAPAGYGLGVATETNVNPDNTTLTGFYHAWLDIQGYSGYVNLEVINCLDAIITQKAYCANGMRFQRVYYNGWSDWVNTSPSAFAPAGYGLGTDWGYAITDANKALLNGVYVCADPSNCTNFPTHEAQQYGPMLVLRRGQNISQTVYFRNRKVCRFSEDNGATWTPWEWENPPLSYGVEYRTTERHNGKSVYVKCVNYGYIAVGTTTIAHGISSIDDVVGLDIINRTYGYFSNSAEVHGSADRTNVSVTSAWAMGGFVYIIKYTKL
jgi:hypothetical protein